MSYHECPKCDGRETVCAHCGKARVHRRYEHHAPATFSHEGHLRARIVKCPGHLRPWYNCDCCGKDHVEGHLYLWANNVFPRTLGSKDSNGVGYCGACASFIRARLEVAFDEALSMVAR